MQDEDLERFSKYDDSPVTNFEPFNVWAPLPEPQPDPAQDILLEETVQPAPWEQTYNQDTRVPYKPILG